MEKEEHRHGGRDTLGERIMHSLQHAILTSTGSRFFFFAKCSNSVAAKPFSKVKLTLRDEPPSSVIISTINEEVGMGGGQWMVVIRTKSENTRPRPRLGYHYHYYYHHYYYYYYHHYYYY